MKVELCRLSDGKVSVRLDGTEITIMPDKDTCEIDDIRHAMQDVVDDCLNLAADQPESTW